MQFSYIIYSSNRPGHRIDTDYFRDHNCPNLAQEILTLSWSAAVKLQFIGEIKPD